jgi:hypothetical protein
MNSVTSKIVSEAVIQTNDRMFRGIIDMLLNTLKTIKTN